MCLGSRGHSQDPMSVCSSDADESSTGSAEDADPSTAVSGTHAAPSCAPKEPTSHAVHHDFSAPRCPVTPGTPAELASTAVPHVVSGPQPTPAFSA